MKSTALKTPAHRLIIVFVLSSALAAYAAAAAGAQGTQAAAQGAGPGDVHVVDYIELTGLLDPASAAFLADQVRASHEAGSSALIVRVDSPGAVAVSPVRLVDQIRAAKIPVIVWLAPGAARAHSAAAFMVAAADIAVMAPQATVGPASPRLVVNSLTPRSERQQESERLRALLRSKLSAAQAAELQKRPFTARTAQEAGLINFRASSLQQLLQGLRGPGPAEAGRGLLQGPFTPRFHKMSLFGRLLHGAARPPAAYLLLLAGIFAILFELYNPGVGGAAVSGGIAAGFSLYGLSVLPTSWLGVALVLAGLAALTADLQASRLGPLTAAGLALLTAGSMVVFAGAPTPMRLPWWAVLAGLAGTLAFYFAAMPAAIRSRIARPLAGAENIVGTHGVARTDVAPEGQVMARGTLWRARTLGAAIAQGSSVEIKGVAGLTLMVEPGGQPAQGPAGPPAGE